MRGGGGGVDEHDSIWQSPQAEQIGSLAEKNLNILRVAQDKFAVDIFFFLGGGGGGAAGYKSCEIFTANGRNCAPQTTYQYHFQLAIGPDENYSVL